MPVIYACFFRAESADVLHEAGAGISVTVHVTWQQIVIRLVLTLLAGALIGFNRGEHGRPAGLRTTMLVCLAASVSMIQANLLLNIDGKTPGSFSVADILRLPLGILTGVGFIGAGAILRRENMVLGVTTAATLWFVTVAGLCLGGGQLGLGVAATVIGAGILWALKSVDHLIRSEHQGVLVLNESLDGPSEAEVREMLASERFEVTTVSVVLDRVRGFQELTCQVQWRAKDSEGNHSPAFLSALQKRPGVTVVQWKPGPIT